MQVKKQTRLPVGACRCCVAMALVLILCVSPSMASPKMDETSVEWIANESDTCVILLHGLARTSKSMQAIAKALASNAYQVANVDYPSRFHPIERLSEMALTAGINACRDAGSRRIHAVTHSLGGILLRDYLSRHAMADLHRVVMLAPPNHGSAIVDKLRRVPGVSYMNGPAFEQLGLMDDSVPVKLGPARVDTAVIAGSRSVNLLLSTLLENPDDGKVSVASTRLDGMCAMLVLKVSHPFIMKNELAIEQTLSYLNTGRFTLAHAEHLDCEFRNSL